MKSRVPRPTGVRARYAIVISLAVAGAAVALLLPSGGKRDGTTSLAGDGSGPATTLPSRRTVALPSTTSSVTTSPPTTVPLSPACLALEKVPTDPLAQQVAQLLFVSVSDPASARAALAGGAGGIFLSGATGWIDGGVLPAIESSAPVVPFAAADEEGGRVMRIAAQFGPIPSAHQMAETMTTGAVRGLAAQRGRDMLSLGLDMDFAPDADLYDASNPVINDRSFSSDPATVVRYATAFAQGLEDAGVVPVAKHFPGHGHSSGNSEVEPVSTPPFSVLEQSDLVPFKDLVTTVPAMMVGHLDVPGLTPPGVPASLSPAAYQLLTRLGFGGLVMTDDLSMGAIKAVDSVPGAAVRAIGAGADMVLITPTYAGEQYGVESSLAAAVRDGAIPASRFAAAVAAVVRLKSVMERCGGG